MCGICGQLLDDPARTVDPGLLARMNETLVHRGPDGEGSFLRGQVGLAMRRLAIIDVAGGDQPIANETGTVQVVFNGEIYNHRALRRQLEAQGHAFRTGADTEVIVHLYEEHGTACVEHLRGMFALALWDEPRRRLLLARDRLGQKPLYWAEHDGGLLFGSEIKALLAVPGLPRSADLEALHHYLTLQYVPDPWTAFEGIHSLPPAHRMVCENGSRHVERYWDVNYLPKLTAPRAELEAEVRAAVTEAVELRLMSEVPLGAHLSGGIDSSIVVGLMAQLTGRPVKTFSIGFEEGGFNELPWARAIAQRFGAEHHELILRPDAMEVLPALVDAFDQPFADPAALPTWYLARMTREHVTVALNGDGGDEAFAGYNRYYADAYADLYRRLPAALRRGVLDRALSALPARADLPLARSALKALGRLPRAAALSHAASKLRWSPHFSHEEKWALYRRSARERLAANGAAASAELLAATFAAAPARGRLDRTLYTDLHHYLPGALLPKVDRTTMAHSLEARSPFLDHRVVELAARLPRRLKVAGRRTKRILRDAFADLLPPATERRGKVGFNVPLGLWFGGPLDGPARDLLLTPESRSRRLLRPEAVAGLLDENRAGRADHGERIWTLLVLESWMRRYSV